MKFIDWGLAQAALTRAGYPCGKIDGIDLEKTWTALFAYVAGRQPDDVIRELGKAAVEYLRNDPIAATPARLAEFLAQIGNETGGFTRFEEDLRYSASRLATVWPSRYAVDPKASVKVPNAKAMTLAYKPEAIANDAYARPSEGNTQPGDGWKYRGRGLLQLTFKNNYAQRGKAVGLDLVAHPELAANPTDSLRIAIGFWHTAGVNNCCDVGDFYGARGLTNAGTKTPKAPPVGLAEVARRRAAVLKVLAA